MMRRFSLAVPDHVRERLLIWWREYDVLVVAALAFFAIPGLPYVTFGHVVGAVAVAGGVSSRSYLVVAIKQSRVFLIVASLAVVGYFVADLYTGSGIAIRSVGYVLWLAAFVVIFAGMCRGDTTRLWRLAVGVAAGWVAVTALLGNGYSSQSVAFFWKYGVSTPVLVLALLVAERRKVRTVWIAAVLLVFVAVSGAADSRSQVLVGVATLVFLLIRRRRVLRPSDWRVTAALLGALLLVALTLPTMFESGLFGSAIRDKTLSQASSGSNFLLEGRTEVPLGIAVIGDSPLIGHGRLDNIGPDLVEKGVALARTMGLKDPVLLRHLWLRDGYPTTHSVIMNAWAEGGVAAALPFLLLLGLAVRQLVTLKAPFPWTATAASITIIWDLLFSPLSSELVPFCALALVWFGTAWAHSNPLSSTTPVDK